MKRLFSGGIHPAEGKSLSAGTPFTTAPAPKKVVLPMLQHIGATCEAMVQVGDRVLLGQKIGQGAGLCAPVHASVSGTVTAVEPRPHPTGKLVLAVEIENDFLDERAPYTAADWQGADAETLIAAIDEAGIVGMGGATFPTSVKLRSGLGRVDTIIINACECEPYITADDCLVSRLPSDVLEGARHLARILKPQRVVVAMERNKPQAAAALGKLLQKGDVELVTLPTRYPQGAEKQLIESITSRQVPPGGLPADVGCAVFNVATCAVVCRALEEGLPLLQRLVTVTGEAVSKPQNFLVRLGTSTQELIDAAGGIRGDCTRVISGGPMMGVAQTRLDVPVLKGTSAILCLTDRQLDHTEHPVCIRCGRCVEACPMHLQPLYLHQYYTQDRPEKLLRARLRDCIDCGCCAYVCPGKLPLVAQFRDGKVRLTAWEREGAK